MKKFLTAVFCFTTLVAGLRAADGFDRANVLKQLDSCEAILQEIQGNVRTGNTTMKNQNGWTLLKLDCAKRRKCCSMKK